MLVNEHSASAAEMVAAFVSEYQLGNARWHDYGWPARGHKCLQGGIWVTRVVMPVATYFTWLGTNLEGRGLQPTVEEPFSFEASVEGGDNQLERAMQIVRETTASLGAPS